MKTSYPYLRISQKYNLEYGVVLNAADVCCRDPEECAKLVGEAVTYSIWLVQGQHDALVMGVVTMDDVYNIFY